jgi:hypothetical protein
MRTTTAMLVARPSAGAERGRILLIAAAAAVAGGLLIAVVRIARVPVVDFGFDTDGVPSLYVSDSSTRLGVMIGAGLLTVPVLAFAVQALRVGSVARDRRMAALRLAGATPRDVRAIAAAEASGAAFVGGLFAGWVYPLLWVLLGVLPPADLRLLPDPEVLDIAVWLGVAGVLILCGVALGIETPFLGSFLSRTAVGAGSYLTVLAIVATVLGIVVAVLTLIVGAADQLLDARLSLATLAAMGVDEATLSRVLHRQLSAPAIPAVLAGALVPPIAWTLAALIAGELLGAIVLVAASTVTAAVAWCVVSGAARLATRVLASRLHAAMDPENLRVG